MSKLFFEIESGHNVVWVKPQGRNTPYQETLFEMLTAVNFFGIELNP